MKMHEGGEDVRKSKSDWSSLIQSYLTVIQRFFGSLLGRLLVLCVIFLLVPVFLYLLFRAADADKQKLLLSNVEERGRLIAEILRPKLEQGGLEAFPAIRQQFSTLAGEDSQIKLLFRPSEAQNPSAFFYVAAAPAVAASALEAEHQRLRDRGVIDVLADSCDKGTPTTTRYQETADTVEIITSVTPLQTPGGCWAVVTAYSTAAYRRSSIGRSYWTTPEVRLAAIIYATMALLTVTVMLGVWQNLRRISGLARDMRLHGRKSRSFAEEHVLTEIGQVANELDRLVGALEQSARSIREAAEDNAHAYKTPLAVISQSVTPLKRIVPVENERGQRAISMIESSIEKLDDLIASAWRMDELLADLIDPPHEKVDLGRMTGNVVRGYGPVLRDRGLTLDIDLAEDCEVLAGEEMLETVIENLIENAAGFASVPGQVRVALYRQKNQARLVVEDNGPGVPEAERERIFERYYSRRTVELDRADDAERAGEAGGQHLGIGLWIVRRNIEAVGGQVYAENRNEGGLRIVVELPCTGAR